MWLKEVGSLGNQPGNVMDLNMDCVSYLKKCDGLNMDCVSYLKDCIRVRGHLRNGDMTNNARREGEYLGVKNDNAK